MLNVVFTFCHGEVFLSEMQHVATVYRTLVYIIFTHIKR